MIWMRNHGLGKKALSLLCVGMISLIGQPIILALPGGEHVISGNVDFQRALNALTIHNSDRAIIHWQDFSIGAGELTNFIQPSASSAVLNRVVGGNLSEIYGTLRSNGHRYS